MSIRVIKEPDVLVTEAELARYRHEHAEAMRYRAGPPVPLETYIRNRIASEKRETQA